MVTSRRQSLKAPFWHQKVHSKAIPALIFSIIACKNNHLPGSDPEFINGIKRIISDFAILFKIHQS
jgi:hypothetical protein